MIEGIDKKYVIEKLTELRGKMAKGRINNIAEILMELCSLQCAEGLYRTSASSPSKGQHFIFLYELRTIDNLKAVSNKYQELNQKVLAESRAKYDIRDISMSDLENPFALFLSSKFYIKKDLMDADCIYANRYAKSLVKRIKL